MLEIVKKFSPELQLKEKVGSSVDENVSIIRLEMVFFFSTASCLLVNVINMKRVSNIKMLVEIFCMLDFAVLFFREEIYVVKITRIFSFRPNHSIYSKQNITLHLSSKYREKINLQELHNPKIETEQCTNTKQFVGYLHWLSRRNALLLAYKYKNGKYFHTLKWIVFFL